jgi:Fic family protein
MLRQYIWQREEWPQLRFGEAALIRSIAELSYAEGRVVGAVQALGEGDLSRLARETLVASAIDTSEIEGERISPASVRASLARRLEIGAASGERDPRADGVVAMTLDAVDGAKRPLTQERIFRWHEVLLEIAPRRITVGAWRPPSDDPMRVVSGPVSARVINYEALPAARIPAEMHAYLTWFESADAAGLMPIVFAALAHLRFEVIHPLSDGNGRIGRAIADLALARRRPDAARYVSLSQQILIERRTYYEELEQAQRGDLDVTRWIAWFAGAYTRAAERTLTVLDELARASRFWSDHANVEINARQRAVLERYLAGGFDGWINSSKYAKLAKTSIDSAQRDIADLVAKGILVANDGKARRTSYRLFDEPSR